jgi:hypothetical protein
MQSFGVLSTGSAVPLYVPLTASLIGGVAGSVGAVMFG